MNSIFKEVAAKFGGVSGLSISSAALNLVTTVLVVRWCGASVYADFMVDLAIVSLLLLLLEVVPSNFSVFRLQDDRQWRTVVEGHLFLVAVLLVVSVFSLAKFGVIFSDFSPWIALYAASQASKRYFDLMLQAMGRLHEFMALEVAISFVRLSYLSLGALAGYRNIDLVWGSLAAAVVSSQIIYAIKRGRTLQIDAPTSARMEAWEVARKFLPYYPGIALKRVKDNLLPLIGSWVLGSKETLGLLMLAYRGVVFASGQIRIFEALLYHRETLGKIEAMPAKTRFAVAGVAQVAAICASVVLLVLSDEPAKPYAAAIMLSFLVWPISFYSIERANALANFNPGRINSALLAYLVFAVAAALCAWRAGMENVYVLIAVFLAAEVLQYLVMKRMRPEVA
jgi:hypothetical protein